MKMKIIVLLTVMAATSVAQVIDPSSNFSRDETAIYRDFLLHYPEQLSNVIGMQATTVAFELPLGRGQKPLFPGLVPPVYHPRKLPTEIMALTTEQAVTARIAAKGKLIPSDKRSPQVGPDGYVRTHLTLSDIAFDPLHKRAVFIFSASCDCLGGQGGAVEYGQKNGHWKLLSISTLWEG